MRNFSAELAGLESQRLCRRRVNDCTQGARLRVGGREHLSFCSNDYLRLAADPRMIAALCEGAQRHGAGAGASHLARSEAVDRLVVTEAFVAGGVELIEMLIQRSRSYIYTTASPPALAWALMKSLELIEAESWQRQRLDALENKLARDLRPRRWQLARSQTPIQPLIIGGNREAVAVSDALARAEPASR